MRVQPNPYQPQAVYIQPIMPTVVELAADPLAEMSVNMGDIGTRDFGPGL